MLEREIFTIENTGYMISYEKLIKYTKRAEGLDNDKKTDIIKKVMREIPIFICNPIYFNCIAYNLHQELYWNIELNKIPNFEAFAAGLAQHIYDEDFILRNLRPKISYAQV